MGEDKTMSTFDGRGRSALLIIDVQNGVVDSAFAREHVIANINQTIKKAREKSIPVIWVQHSDEELVIDSDAWQIVHELVPQAGDMKVRKIFRNSFEETELESILASLQVDRLFICGAQTNNCVRHTCHAALERGYDITLIKDGHTTSDYEWKGRTVVAENVINEQNDNLFNYTLPNRSASVIESSAITF